MAPVHKLLMLLQSSLSDELVLLICSSFEYDFGVSAPLSVTCKHYYQLVKPELALHFLQHRGTATGSSELLATC